eukprot:COSAG03_NODE_15141_length_440_cov_0.724340_1_plen_76_part_01
MGGERVPRQSAHDMFYHSQTTHTSISAAAVLIQSVGLFRAYCTGDIADIHVCTYPVVNLNDAMMGNETGCTEITLD